jgi:hypothetical protein
LYYVHNSSSLEAPPSDIEFVVPVLKSLIVAKASQTSPLKNVKISGLGFRDTVYTFMDPHGVPSGGDWALQRTAALFFEGTEGVTIEHCVFERLDGQALQISGYSRKFTVQYSDFRWIGDSAITSWGYTDELSDEGRKGFDGTDGNHPQENTIRFNVIREVGMFEKQSSFYMQAKTCLSTIEGNVMFNGPRAGINFNVISFCPIE